jgi:hypothetical protein
MVDVHHNPNLTEGRFEHSRNRESQGFYMIIMIFSSLIHIYDKSLQDAPSIHYTYRVSSHPFIHALLFPNMKTPKTPRNANKSSKTIANVTTNATPLHRNNLLPPPPRLARPPLPPTPCRPFRLLRPPKRSFDPGARLLIVIATPQFE